MFCVTTHIPIFLYLPLLPPLPHLRGSGSLAESAFTRRAKQAGAEEALRP